MIKFDNNNNNYNIEENSFLQKWESSLKKGKTLSILFAGVGGQGIILATTVLAHAAINSGHDVKVSEVHGMAQRGGSVEGSVRIGKKVFSPTIGKADCIVALEKLEGLRYSPRLKGDGVIIINNYEIYPSTVSSKDKSYPSNIGFLIEKITKNHLFVDTANMVKDLKEIRISNTVLLGVLSKFLPIKIDCWIKSLSENVPQKALELNLKAFNYGRNLF